MAIKNILVSYNGTPSSQAALDLALKMAEKYDAHLTGLLSYGPSRMTVALGPWVTPETLESIQENEGAAGSRSAPRSTEPASPPRPPGRARRISSISAATRTSR